MGHSLGGLHAIMTIAMRPQMKSAFKGVILSGVPSRFSFLGARSVTHPIHVSAGHRAGL